MLVALVAAATLFVAPPGFTEAKVLEPAASYVAGKPVHVYCARTDLDLREYTQQMYGGNPGYEVGLALPGQNAALLGQSQCYPLIDQLHKRKDDRYDLAESILTLVHESVHLRGVTDEGQTECSAMHEMPRVAVKFFHVKPGKQLRALMSDAWSAHRAKPAVYQSVC